MNPYTELEYRVKEFCRNMYIEAKLSPKETRVNQYYNMAYGVVQFAVNNLFPSYNANLAVWWLEYEKEFIKLL